LKINQTYPGRKLAPNRYAQVDKTLRTSILQTKNLIMQNLFLKRIYYP